MGTTKTTQQAVKRYMKTGYAPIPIPPGSKNPNRDDWQHERHTIEDIQKIWNNGQGVGLLLGEPSGGLADTDLDCEEAVELGGRFLPPTRTSGREGIPDSHWWYLAPGTTTTKFKDIDGEMLVELRSTGCQTIVEPSIHPTGARYLWSRSGLETEAVDAGDLLKACRSLAAAVLIARHLPQGGRHDLALALAGFLLRNGLPDEDVLNILIAAWSVRGAPREALRDLEGIVRDTRDKLNRGEPVKGGRTLEELVGGMPKTLAKFFAWAKADTRERRQSYTHSDLGNAERFLDLYRDRVRWCPARKMWLIFDGKRWVWDECGKVVKLAQEAARSIHKDAAAEPDSARQREIAKFAIVSQNAVRINGMLSQARPHVAVRLEELDVDPWLLNCQNGTLNLKSGELASHNPADLITKIVPADYDPDAECPRFKQFLEEVLVEDAVIDFLQRFAGYSATGITRERVLAILHGGGKNGKTTLVEVLQDALGDYSTNTDTETILAKRYQGVGNDVAALKGARFVSAAEVEQGRQLAESKVKQLTGSDTVTARFLFGEPFNFRPQFKLWLSTNNKPEIRGADDAIWDRLRLVPFTQRFDGEHQDRALPEKLRSELPGVLAWMVEGCREWLRVGLDEPESVTAATEQYRSEMDVLGSFIDDRCVVHPHAVSHASALYTEYQAWCTESGEYEHKQRVFGMRLTERGFRSTRLTSGPHKGRKAWVGIGLRVNDGGPDDSENGDETRPNGSQNGNDGSPSEQWVNDGSPHEKRGFAGVSTNSPGSGERSERKKHNSSRQKPREEKDVETSFTSFTSFTPVVEETNYEAREDEDRAAKALDECIHGTPGGCLLCRENTLSAFYDGGEE